MMRASLLGLACLLFVAQPAAASPVIQEIKTSSGYTVWLAEDHKLPIATYSFAFAQSGAAYDPEKKDGLSSFLTQMLDEGAGDMDSLAFHQTLENKAIRYNAESGQDFINITVQSLSEHKEEALKLMLLTLTEPRFDKDALERIRASIISDLTQLSEEPNYIASREWKKLAFGSHPYAHPRRGTPESVKSITREDLQRYAKTHFFADSPPIIAVAGDVTPDEIRNWPLPAIDRAANAPVLAEAPLQDDKTPHIITHPVPQTVVLMSYPGMKRNDAEFYTLEVLNHIIGGSSLTSRLGSEIRNKRGLAYFIGSGIEVMDHSGAFTINFATRNAEVNKTLELVRGILADIRDKGVSEEEISSAKSYLVGSYPLEHDTQPEMAGNMLGIQHFHMGIDYMDKRNSLIEKVTLAQVNALAQKLLSHDPLIVMVGDPNGELAKNGKQP